MITHQERSMLGVIEDAVRELGNAARRLEDWLNDDRFRGTVADVFNEVYPEGLLSFDELAHALSGWGVDLSVARAREEER